MLEIEPHIGHDFEVACSFGRSVLVCSRCNHLWPASKRCEWLDRPFNYNELPEQKHRPKNKWQVYRRWRESTRDEPTIRDLWNQGMLKHMMSRWFPGPGPWWNVEMPHYRPLAYCPW